MNKNALLALCATLFTISTFAQSKVFSFSEIQCRNSHQQWEKSKKIGKRTIQFSDQTIEVSLDRDYFLNIVTATLLPDQGVIYLCTDEKQNQVTVTLINNDKMFFYSSNKRYLVNFNHLQSLPLQANSFADND